MIISGHRKLNILEYDKLFGFFIANEYI